MHFSVVSAYVIGAVVCLVLFAISALVANLIPYDASKDRKDIGKRRLWFWVISVLVPVAIYIIAWIAVYSDLKVPSQKVSYMTAMGISAGVMFVVYVLLGLILSKVMKSSKLGSWF